MKLLEICFWKLTYLENKPKTIHKMFIFKAEKALEILTPILTVMERRTSNRIISEL